MSDKKYNMNWKSLHDNGYFKNHRLYNDFKILKPHNVEAVDVRDLFVLDIGCGYGRHLGWFCQHASYVAGIDVSPNVLSQANDFLNGVGNYGLFLADEYENTLNVYFDYVFSRFVFQHISKDQTKRYIEWIKNHLSIIGKINLQFRVGTFSGFVDGIEPRTEYTINEIKELLKDFKIDSIEYNENMDNVYIIGSKI